jgi:hypothetical protein
MIMHANYGDMVLHTSKLNTNVPYEGTKLFQAWIHAVCFDFAHRASQYISILKDLIDSEFNKAFKPRKRM